jgi:hypothetical protein
VSREEVGEVRHGRRAVLGFEALGDAFDDAHLLGEHHRVRGVVRRPA